MCHLVEGSFKVFNSSFHPELGRQAEGRWKGRRNDGGARSPWLSKAGG